MGFVNRLIRFFSFLFGIKFDFFGLNKFLEFLNILERERGKRKGIKRDILNF